MKKQKKRLHSFVITYVYKDVSESMPFKVRKFYSYPPSGPNRASIIRDRYRVSRAMENQPYVLALNRSGSDFIKLFAEQSLIIDPWGNIVCEADEERTPNRYPGPLKSNGSM
ncbi:nitrilase-related carbon-nitrogen hydrolase [Peribacillus sp. TH14]|uniref:nitrilase-related carbon-nitrogen hydrolase n=1 Tax=Peribacillus sp. TH14 TaxID=2798481 RepID=UPI0019144B81|nr:nitrilase-related carbon-nitrogen hydrolase [Peribacillus sp. TH14]MBK5501310.1 hypothetical protein [Peribacillus sp. TH14]